VFPWSPDFPPLRMRYDLAAHNAPLSSGHPANWRNE